ncbi:unnamed protein product, partial [Ixodes persulcatus]
SSQVRSSTYYDGRGNVRARAGPTRNPHLHRQHAEPIDPNGNGCDASRGWSTIEQDISTRRSGDHVRARAPSHHARFTLGKELGLEGRYGTDLGVHRLERSQYCTTWPARDGTTEHAIQEICNQLLTDKIIAVRAR